MLSLLPITFVVYSLKPRSVTTLSSLVNSGVPSELPPKPSWGIGLPVSSSEMKMAGTV